MRISDWSSDVCSSDLVLMLLALAGLAWVWRRRRRMRQRQRRILGELDSLVRRHREDGDRAALLGGLHQLLRRVAREQDAAVVHLRGAAWRQALARVPVDAATLDNLHRLDQIGRAHVRTPVTNAHLVCRLLLEKKKTIHK